MRYHKQCLECKSDYPTAEYRSKFCSRSCAAKHNNRGVNRWANKERTQTNKNGVQKRTYTRRVRISNEKCVDCGGSISLGTKTNRCRSCHNLGEEQRRLKEKERQVEAWLRGEITGTYPNGAKFLKSVRAYILDQAGNQCSVCGWNAINPTTGLSPLHIDHVNGNSFDNSPSNLRVLCPNCHSLTSTFGALNRGNGRKKKLDYYHNVLRPLLEQVDPQTHKELRK